MVNADRERMLQRAGDEQARRRYASLADAGVLAETTGKKRDRWIGTDDVDPRS